MPVKPDKFAAANPMFPTDFLVARTAMLPAGLGRSTVGSVASGMVVAILQMLGKASATTVDFDVGNRNEKTIDQYRRSRSAEFIYKMATGNYIIRRDFLLARYSLGSCGIGSSHN